ncbi:ciliary neurotrophic factor [Trachemys scripta elegans]|uniref:ciliary neurotrophic factor n=1 Tax=Trachemys scripta elegans TaxID=31138 RepID=UPI001555AE0A|nr:ciliary neurotrophic factor [Trachemys scripta elegans]
MASAEQSPVPLQHHNLCNRIILLARKIRSDVASLLESYVERQGLDRTIGLDSVDGVPVAAVEQGSELTVAEQLGANLQAYRAFQALLGEVLEEQRSHLTPLDTDFHASIQAVLLQVAALAYQLEELLALLGHSRPAWEAAGPEAPGRHSLFEMKLRGLKVLQELAHWTVRSVRDLRRVATHSQGSGTAQGGQAQKE